LERFRAAVPAAPLALAAGDADPPGVVPPDPGVVPAAPVVAAAPDVALPEEPAELDELDPEPARAPVDVVDT
jgi:hypothetical protein